MANSKENFLIRVQSPDGIKRIEISRKAQLHELFVAIETSLKVKGFALYRERNFTNELMRSNSQRLVNLLQHGDMIYLKENAGNTGDHISIAAPTQQQLAIEAFDAVFVTMPKLASLAEDEVDKQLYRLDGRIKRERNSRLCQHNVNGSCIHCLPLEPYDDDYLQEHNIKHMSFHAYLRKQKEANKFVDLETVNCSIKKGCITHPPWPKGICSKCQPLVITMCRQPYRHVDNVRFENKGIVERFLGYWHSTGHQRLGYLYGRYELHTDVPLGIRATVSAIYEPPQICAPDYIELLPDDHAENVQVVANALNLKCVGWIFTDLIHDNATSVGNVKQLRGRETHFLTAHECILAAILQNRHPNVCSQVSSGYFGSKFVTVCLTGNSQKQIQMEGYAMSEQCMALVRDNCLIPTKNIPELAYVRESTDKQFVPDVFYVRIDEYGNEVRSLARPLPVEYMLVDVPTSTPIVQQYTFTQYDKRDQFPVENRNILGHMQTLTILSCYLNGWWNNEYLEAMSDFHLLLYLYNFDKLPLHIHLPKLLEAVRSGNSALALEFKAGECWKSLESLINIF